MPSRRTRTAPIQPCLAIRRANLTDPKSYFKPSSERLNLDAASQNISALSRVPKIPIRDNTNRMHAADLRLDQGQAFSPYCLA